MHSLTFDNLIWLFLIYSFIGWVLETVTATIRQKQFVNRGLINSPFCSIYGITAVVITVFLKDLTGIWLFLFAAIYATVIEWIGGHLIEKFFKEKWWDYSKVKWNLDGYICLPASLLWGALAYVAIRFGNDFILSILRLFPRLIMDILMFTLLGLLILDALASYYLLTKTGNHLQEWEETNNRFVYISARLEHFISGQVRKRINKAYPQAIKKAPVETQEHIFAYGCSFYKIVLLFFIGAFLGDITETIFCRITAGVWMSRSSVVWGSFSIVWGLALAVATLLLYPYKEKGEGFLFCMGTFLGGAYEYLCSVFTEIFFGQVFWDYSKIPFNLGGRINLLYCFFWGIAAVVWIRNIYPVFSKLIEKISIRPGKILTWALIVFMSCNLIVSSMALSRYNQRSKDVPAAKAWQEWMDVHYNDEKMQKIYPNSKTVK